MQIGFIKHSPATSKQQNTKGEVNKAKVISQHHITKTIEDYSVPLSMVMNFDQMILKYNHVASQTLSQKNGAKHVPIYGVTYNKAIAVTFGIKYTIEFLSV